MAVQIRKMTMKNNPMLLSMAVLLTIVFSACTMKQEIYIDQAGTGSVSIDVNLADYLTEVISQVQVLVDPENPRPADAPFFDIEAISDDFARREGVHLNTIESPSDSSLSGSFDFDDVNALYQKVDRDSAESRLINLDTSGEIKEFKVNITRETIRALLEENPSMNNPLVVNFGPTANEGVSENDYLDMMGFALGAESRQGIIDSNLSLSVVVDGSIVDQQGGVLINESTVEFDIPLLPVLLLNSPLEYSLRYR